MAQLSDITNPHELVCGAYKTCLHVGCGGAGREATHHQFHGPEWRHIRLDIDPDVQPDVIGDIRSLDGIDDASVDGIFSSHNLEHLHYDEVFEAIKSFRRVLKDRGRLVAVVPDFQLACDRIALGQGLQTLYISSAGPITPFDMVFGYRRFTKGNVYQRHLSGFTEPWLKTMLIDQGFSGVETTTSPGFDIWAYARKLA